MHGKVLIIDPIATNGIILKVKFSAACYTVTQTLTLAEAIAAIGSSRPDIVITANELHDRTALHLVAQMREQPKAQNIPIIAITCHCWKLGLMLSLPNPSTTPCCWPECVALCGPVQYMPTGTCANVHLATWVLQRSKRYLYQRVVQYPFLQNEQRLALPFQRQ